jgi:exopolysaccharide biosynthesis polyprenyl glycosylphosphotransferase
VHEIRRRFLLTALKCLDLLLLAVSFGTTAILIIHGEKAVPISEFLFLRVRVSNFVIFAVLLFAWHELFTACGLYESKRISPRSADLIEIAKATALSTTCLLALTTLLTIRMVTASFLILFWLCSFALVAVSRMALKTFLAAVRRRGHDQRCILILGTNSRAVEFAQRIADPSSGYRLLGFVDDQWQRLDDFRNTGLPLLCSYAGLAEVLRNNTVDEVAIFWPLSSFFERSFEVAARCQLQGITARLGGGIFALKTMRPSAEVFADEHFIPIDTSAHDGGALFIKRLLDIALSVVSLILLAPLFLVVALLIKLSSRGPVFFSQERVGMNKRRFRIRKFRTMVPDAERMLPELEQRNEASGPVFKIKHDPRTTRIGRILRRTSIDELPQLLNVLIGDMSLVGPRPLPIRDYQGFREDWQRRRFSVRPGITCLWQVRGRSALGFDEWMKLDLQYMDEWSIWLDLKILAWTIPVVMKGTGAA